MSEHILHLPPVLRLLLFLYSLTTGPIQQGTHMTDLFNILLLGYYCVSHIRITWLYQQTIICFFNRLIFNLCIFTLKIKEIIKIII